MKRSLPILIILLISFNLKAQVLVPPHFRGGEQAFHNFLSDHIKLPKDTGSAVVRQGSVVVGFIVEKDGTLSDLHVIKHLTPYYDAQALKVMNISPRWVPATRDDRFIKSKYSYSLNFYLVD
ncbi:hypothetical protein BH09BAC6_BH09BAC6_33410 [soil metagenome]|jgi:protein TonB